MIRRAVVYLPDSTSRAAAGGVILSALFARFLPEAPGREERVGRLLKGMGNRDLFYVVLLAFILLLLWRAPNALPFLVGLLALGSHGYWLTCLARGVARR